MNSNSFKKKPVVIQAFTFDEVIAHGREHASNVTNGMPWSFTFRGHPITHGRDDCYILATLEGTNYLTPDDVLILGVRGEIYPISKEVFEETYEPAATEEVETVSEVPVVNLPERVIDMLFQDAGVSTYHPDGDQQEKLHAFARNVVAETIARLPAVKPVEKEAVNTSYAGYSWQWHYNTTMKIIDSLQASIEMMQAVFGLDDGEDASEGVLVAAETLIAADRAQTLTDDHINALECAIKIQRGEVEIPTPIGYQVVK